mmetsp:Transcript_22712/g.47278  ORF Transcript_22712/g.47278 Transcript_22712/m.47278 type:complete len:219 (+) Transcript_22712:114-770(+)
MSEEASPASIAIPRPTAFSVVVFSESFKFNLAHFVAYRGFRERLHGHNYRLSIELLGSRISSDGYVMDFGDVKTVARAACKQLNERVVVPSKSDVLDIRPLPTKPDHTILTCEDATVFVFPTSDCFFAPIMHSTVEEISLMMYGMIVEQLGASKLLERGIHKIKLKLSEAPGQESSIEIPVTNGFDRSTWEKSGFGGTLKCCESFVKFDPSICGPCKE